MMEFIRNKSKGIVMWAIVGLIIIPFAMFGVQDYLSGASSVVPAVVNGSEISSAQLTRAVQQRKQQLQQQLGANYQPDLFPADFLRQQVLNDLISRKLVRDFTVTANMSASSKQIFNEITQIPQFKDGTGKFSAKIYTRAIKGAGRTKAGFEAEVAKDYVLNQLRAGVFNTSFALPYEVKQTQNLLNQKRDIAYLKFTKSKYKQDKSIPDSELKQYYESHLASYKTEEKINVEYVELDINQIAAKVDVPAAKISAYYDSNISRYTEKDYPAALTMINNVQRRLDKGESFDSLAKEMSPVDGGDLGFIRKGTMDEAFDEVAFKLKKGEVSKPVKSAFGYHLIKVIDSKGDERKVKHILVKPLSKAQELNAAVRAKIKKEIQIQEAGKTFFEDVEKFSNLAYENADSLSVVAAGLDLKIKSSGLVSRRGLTGVLVNPQVSSAIFSDEVLNKGKNSDVIELKETHMIVVRIKEHQAAAQKTFAEVKANVTKQVAIQHQIDAMKKEVNAAFKNLTLGAKGVEQPALFRNSQWTPAQFVSRRSSKDLNIPVAIVQQAFTLSRPTKSKPSIGMVDLVNGDQAIVVVSDVKDADKIDTAEETAISQQLQQANTNTEFLGFEKYLKDNAEIKINLGKEKEQDI